MQIYHLIDIDDQVLSFKSYLASGELLDGFDLIKQKGKPNKLVTKVDSVNQGQKKREDLDLVLMSAP